MTGNQYRSLSTSDPSQDSERYIPETHPPAAFWDSLSRLWLTKGALKEHRQRIRSFTSAIPRSQSPRARRPPTRQSLAEWKKKRRVIQSASDFLRHCVPRTLQDLKLFARHGGPDLSDLKGFSGLGYFSNHTMGSGRTSARGRKQRARFALDGRSSSKSHKTTQTSGPYSRNFEQKLVDNGIYLDELDYHGNRVLPEPDNMKKIRQRLSRPRSSLSSSRFSNEKFKEFKRANGHASKESKVFRTVIPFIEGKIADDKCWEGEVLFTNLQPLADDFFTMAKPDLYYGSRPEQLDRRVRQELNAHIIPSKQDELPLAPNFFLVVKGPHGNLQVGKRQACYEGALGARGMHTLQSFEKHESTNDNNAYTITSTYLAGFLQIYTIHPTQSSDPGSRTEYCMNLLRAFAINDSANSFRQGVTAYRNARDWAKEQRDEAIRLSNEKVNDKPNETLTVSANSSSGKIPSPSFSTEETSLESSSFSTIEPPRQDSQIPLDQHCNIQPDPLDQNQAMSSSSTKPKGTATRSARSRPLKRSHQRRRRTGNSRR